MLRIRSNGLASISADTYHVFQSGGALSDDDLKSAVEFFSLGAMALERRKSLGLNPKSIDLDLK